MAGMDATSLTDTVQALALTGAGCALVWGGSRVVERLTSAPTPTAPTPAPAPKAAESLDQVLARLKAKTGDIVDPVRASRMAESRDPTAFAPTAETIALARQYQAYELRLKRAKARREAVAALKARIHSTYRTLARRLGFWS